MNIQNDFEEFLRLLKENDVRFVIVGGYAVAFHGFIRTTNDLDIFFKNEPTNIRKIEKALVQFGFRKNSIKLSDFHEPGSIIRMGLPPVRIEMINTISGVSFDDAWQNKIIGKYGDIETYFVGYKELIKNKKAAGRPKDLIDLDELNAE